jgi:hypothetical protein
MEVTKQATFIQLITTLVYFNSIGYLYVLYGCETWSLTLREEPRLSVFENRVFMRIFGAKRDEVTEEWRKLHNEELNDLYCSPNIVRVIKSRRMRWVGVCSTYGVKGEGHTGFWRGNAKRVAHVPLNAKVNGRKLRRCPT